MRSLFASERRCVSNLFRMKWQREFPSSPVVMSETIAEPAKVAISPRFNCDFILDFVDWRKCSSERAAAACSVLPNALGAELFLVVEKDTLSPTALELNGGGAFEIRRYANYIDVVEAAITEALTAREHEGAVMPWHELHRRTPIRKSTFARLLVVGNDVTFLYCPDESTPVIRGKRIGLAERADRQIDCYVDDKQVVAFDGWVRTQVPHAERTLVAIPGHHP